MTNHSTPPVRRWQAALQLLLAVTGTVIVARCATTAQEADDR